MKKTIISILTIVVVLSLMSVTVLAAGSWGSMSLSASKAEVAPNEEFTVALYLGDCSSNGIVNYRAVVNVPAGLTVVSADVDSGFGGATGMYGPTANSNITSSGDTEVVFSSLGSLTKPYLGGKVKIGTITLKASATGTYKVSFAEASLTDTSWGSQTPTTNSVSVTVAVPHVHSYRKAVTAATCTTDGYTTYTCACGDSYIADKVAAKGHSYKSTVVKPTCTTDGSTTYTCSVCGDKYTETTPALGHKAGASVKENQVAATCDKDGKYDEVVYCSVCKEEMSRKTVTVPALGHKAAPAVKEKEVAPTCVMFGSYDEVVYCSVCNEEMSRKNVKVPALGHKPGAEVEENRVEATCTVDGSYDKVTYCTVCKAEVSRETVKIPAPGHKVAKDYANDDKGHYHYCEVCQEMVGEAEAHKGGKWICTETTHKRSCSVCGFVMVEGDHDFDENGVCVICGYDSNKDPVPPTGDITAVIVTSAFAMVAAIAAAAYMLKRKFNV